MTTTRLAAAIFLAALVVPTAGRSQESPADAFVSAVAAFAERDIADDAWIGPESPWAPYLAEQFSASLSEADRALWLARQSVGECQTLLTLEQRGIFNRYPDLAQAFRDATVRTVFETVIVPRHSFGHRRCVAVRDVIPVIEGAKRRALLIDDSFFSPTVFIWSDDPAMRTDAPAAYREALILLYRLALCDRYRPAIADVIELEIDLQAAQLSHYADMRWLEDVAETAGLDYEKARQHKNLLRTLTDPHTIWLAEGPYNERDAVGTPVPPPRNVARLCGE